jgi:predicted ribosome quality control (RQC) complex YloA/Tae2 family protein
LIISGKNAQ